MRDHDAALDQAIREAAAILGDTLVCLLFPNLFIRQLDVTLQQLT